MSDHPPLLADVDHDAWAQGLLQRQAAMLEQLGEAGLRLALAIERSVGETAGTESAPEPADPAQAAMAFARVARAVRLTALLQSKLVQDMGRLRAAALAGAQAEAPFDPADRHKARVEAVVERVAKAGRDDEDEIDRLVCEAGERLDDEDIYGEVLERPVGELVSLICRDLGLEPDWSRLAEEAWARTEAAAGDPRSPFVLTEGSTRPPPQAGKVAQRAGGGIPPPLWVDNAPSVTEPVLGPTFGRTRG